MKNFDKIFLAIILSILFVLVIVAAFMFGEEVVPKSLGYILTSLGSALASLPSL